MQPSNRTEPRQHTQQRRTAWRCIWPEHSGPNLSARNPFQGTHLDALLLKVMLQATLQNNPSQSRNGKHIVVDLTRTHQNEFNMGLALSHVLLVTWSTPCRGLDGITVRHDRIMEIALAEQLPPHSTKAERRSPVRNMAWTAPNLVWVHTSTPDCTR